MSRFISQLVPAVLLGGLFLSLSAPAAATEPGQLRFEGREILSGPRHSEDRRHIEAALERARVRSLLSEKSVADRLQVNAHTVELTWPVRESVGFASPSVQAISNYLDQNPFDNALDDWNCGGDNARTYDGHNGLDIYLAPFSWYQMEQDAGIVVAAAPGVIVDKVNDQPERSCTIDNSGGENNVVVIEHADGSLGIYAHMRTGSLTAKPLGATVERGEYLGVIGSSGYSTGPHLHFEVGFWENGGWTPQDPWSGQCNDINTDTWWRTQPEYYEPGIMAVSTHSGSPSNPPCPQTENPRYADAFDSGDTVFVSFTIRDLLLNDTVDIEVRMPNGNIYTSTSYTEGGNEHIPSAFISFSFGLPGSAMAGEWEFRISFKGEQESHFFRVDTPASAPPVLQASNNAYNGLWYDRDKSGDGYNIITTRSGTVIYFYGSDANGKRIWLVSELITTAFVNSQQKRIVMYESTGGTHAQPIGSGRGLSIWGELRLTFSSCNAGSARLVGEDGNKLSPLTKLAGVPGSNCVSAPLQATSPYAGLWYDPGLSGEGFNLIVAPPGTVLYYYGFDSNGDRLWLVTAPFEFSYADGAEITVELLKANAGTFLSPAAGALVSWGTMTITGISCNRMSYVLDTNEGDKVMAARRLVSVVGLDC